MSGTPCGMRLQHAKRALFHDAFVLESRQHRPLADGCWLETPPWEGDTLCSGRETTRGGVDATPAFVKPLSSGLLRNWCTCNENAAS